MNSFRLQLETNQIPSVTISKKALCCLSSVFTRCTIVIKRNALNVLSPGCTVGILVIGILVMMSLSFCSWYALSFSLVFQSSLYLRKLPTYTPLVYSINKQDVRKQPEYVLQSLCLFLEFKCVTGR